MKKIILISLAFLIVLLVVPSLSLAVLVDEPIVSGSKNVSNEYDLLGEKVGNEYRSNLVVPFVPQVVPPDPLVKTLKNMGLSGDEIKAIKTFLGILPGLAKDALVDKIADLLKVGNVKTGAGLIGDIIAAKDAYNKWMNFEADITDLSTLKKQQALYEDLAEKTTKAFANILPPGASQVLVATQKAFQLKLELEFNKQWAEIEEKEKYAQGDVKVKVGMDYVWLSDLIKHHNKIMEKSGPYGVVGDLQIAAGCFGQGFGPGGEQTKIKEQWDTLKYLPPSRVEKIYNLIKSVEEEAKEGSISLFPPGSAAEFKKHMPVGGAFWIKMSPVYMEIIDPDGKKYGVDPETQDLICEEEVAFCSSLYEHTDPQIISTHFLKEGSYTIKLIGFENGEFAFSFTAMDNNYKVQGTQDIKGNIKKGEVLEGELIITKEDDILKVSEIKLVKVKEDYVIKSNPRKVPFRVKSISPPNGSIFSVEKPIITVVFDKPLSKDNEFNILLDEKGKHVQGIKWVDGPVLYFVPSHPLLQGNYTLLIKDIVDKFGSKLLDESSTAFKVVRKLNDNIKYKLSDPEIYNFTTGVLIKNNNIEPIKNIVVRLPIFKDNYPNVFIRYLGSSLSAPKIEKDGYGNNWGVWNIPSLGAGNELAIELYFTGLVFGVDYFDYIDAESVGGYDKNSDLYKRFTQASDGIESSHRTIVGNATEIIGSSENPYVKAEKIYEWMKRNIDYMYEGEGDPGGGALATLTLRKGVCHGYSSLYTALLRAAGVPAKYVVTLVPSDENKDSLEAHAYNELYLPNYGWLPVDTTWGMMVNDWFLVSGASRIKGEELWPPIEGMGTSYLGPAPEITYYYNHKILEEEGIQDNRLKELYRAVEAVSFKERELKELPKEISVKISEVENEGYEPGGKNEKKETNESNLLIKFKMNKTITAEFNELPRAYPVLSNTLDDDIFRIQKATDAYFDKNFEAMDPLLEDMESSIYGLLLETCKDLLNKYKKELEDLEKEYAKSFSPQGASELPGFEYEIRYGTSGVNDSTGADLLNKYKKELEDGEKEHVGDFSASRVNDSKGTNLNDTTSSFGMFSYHNYPIYFPNEEKFMTIAEIVSESEKSLAFAEESLKEGDYEATKVYLDKGIYYLNGINMGKSQLESDYAMVRGILGDVYSQIFQLGSGNLGTATASGAILSLVLVGLLILWCWMLINCLRKRKEEFNYLGKISWFFIIILLTLLGALLYFICEYRKRKEMVIKKK